MEVKREERGEDMQGRREEEGRRANNQGRTSISRGEISHLGEKHIQCRFGIRKSVIKAKTGVLFPK